MFVFVCVVFPNERYGTGSLSDAQERLRTLSAEKDKAYSDMEVLYAHSVLYTPEYDTLSELCFILLPSSRPHATMNSRRLVKHTTVNVIIPASGNCGCCQCAVFGC